MTDHDTTGEFCDEFCAPECAGCEAPPPVKGGEGRTPEDLTDSARDFGVIGLCLFFMVVGILVGAAL